MSPRAAVARFSKLAYIRIPCLAYEVPSTHVCVDPAVFQAALVLVAVAVAAILLVLRLLVSLSLHRSLGQSPLSHDKTSSKISRRAEKCGLREGSLHEQRAVRPCNPYLRWHEIVYCSVAMRQLFQRCDVESRLPTRGAFGLCRSVLELSTKPPDA